MGGNIIWATDFREETKTTTQGGGMGGGGGKVKTTEYLYYPFRPGAKTAVDQTAERSITTQPLTIQPPPLPGIFEVPGSGSLLTREPASG